MSDVLNADAGVLVSGVRDGFRWWIDELAAMFAPASTRAFTPPDVLAEADGAGAYHLRGADGSSWTHRAGDRRITAALLLPADATLVRSITTPPLPERDLRRMIALDLDRLTPFQPDAIYFDVRRAGPPDATGQVPARLAAAPKDRVAAELAAAAAAGLTVDALLVADGDDAFDLLPRVGETSRASWTRSPAAQLWAVVVLLLATNVSLAVWKDVRFTQGLQATAAAQQPVVDRIRRLDRQALAWRALEAAQLAARDRGEPLRVLDALSRDLLDSAWLSRFTLEDGRAHLVGQQTGAVDPVAALRRDPAFADIHGADQGLAAGAVEPLDITLALTPPPARAAP